MKINLVLFIVLSFSFLAFSDPVESSEKSTARAEAVPTDLNAILAKRADVRNEMIRLRRKRNRAWADPKNTTEEIQALRKRYRELLEETERVRLEIKQKVSSLPQIKAIEDQIQILDQQVKDLEDRAKKVSAVKEK